MEMHIIFRGRVQGVGFRFFAERCAKEIGLAGYVRNREDGGVEVCVQGEETDLKRFIERLEKEFQEVIVGMEKRKGDETENFERFSIRF